MGERVELSGKVALVTGSKRALVEGVAREMGGIDVLVNNAAIFESHPVPEVDFAGWQDAWTRTIATNLMGPAILAPPCATAKPDDQDSEKKAPIHRSAQDGMFRRDGTSEPVSLPRMSGLFPLTPPLPPPL
jgi:hypothetical protein